MDTIESDSNEGVDTKYYNGDFTVYFDESWDNIEKIVLNVDESGAVNDFVEKVREDAIIELPFCALSGEVKAVIREEIEREFDTF